MRDMYIRIYDKKGEQVFSINVRTSAAVTYPNDALGRTLTFNVKNCQLYTASCKSNILYTS